jgi:hypothetical protein
MTGNARLDLSNLFRSRPGPCHHIISKEAVMSKSDIGLTVRDQDSQDCN